MAPKHDIVIHVDRELVKIKETSLSGGQIRQVVSPPIGAERDLYLEVPGDVDQLVADSDIVQIKNGQHFFSAPREITPGLA